MTVAIAPPTATRAIALIELLVAQNHSIRALARNPERAASRLRDRIDVREGSVVDDAYVRSATEGVTALLWVTSNNHSFMENVFEQLEGSSRRLR